MRALPLLPLVASAATQPHILTFIADDYGWANVGFHRHPGDGGGAGEIVTPHVDKLVKEGIELDRHYAYHICSPSRSSFQSGRLPVHVNVENADPTCVNPADPVGGYAGIPVNMTGIAEKMRAAGYKTHMTGKWDVGMATYTHSPSGRGYDSWLGYFHHANDYWTEGLPFAATGVIDVCQNKYTDLWLTNEPAYGLNGTAYEEELFTNHTVAVINAHDPSEPLFLVHAFHVVHTPLQAPQAYFDEFSFINDTQRLNYTAMVKYLDDAVGAIISTVRAKPGMWENMLVVFTSDNGGPIYYPAGANNWPLKGGKFSDWEGGVRVNAFVSGGFVPAARRGSKSEALVHIADWYATFCGLAGVSTDDPAAAAAKLHAVDGINVWPHLAGENATAPRGEVHLSAHALIQGRLKVLVGTVDAAGWTGPSFPNNTCQPTDKEPWKCQPYCPAVFPVGLWGHDCGKKGCLYDIFADPTEHHNLADARPDDAARLVQRLAELNEANYNPKRGSGDKAACAAAERYGGFYGPFVGV
eukprot:TRINITY_DN84_c0_g1_i1.p1 TRINITY_DN84_c0_g1~~TRINITY_DN84_c0_g1_i1.p1  ORF type:complete len:546 (+),score=187.82 TRINITY_DN84_c0_g1_i1:63-1640(+)